MNIGSILSGLLADAEHDIEQGVEKGIGYFRQVEEIGVWAAKQFSRPDFMQNEVFALVQCGQVTEQWLIELYGAERTATSTLQQNVITYFEAVALGNAPLFDPFHLSRQMAQELVTKFGKAAGIS